jgi:hypothetical protein
MKKALGLADTHYQDRPTRCILLHLATPYPDKKHLVALMSVQHIYDKEIYWVVC